MNFSLRIVLCSGASVLALLYSFAELSSILKYCDLINAADRLLFPVPHLLSPGFRLLELFGKSDSNLVFRISDWLDCEDFTAFCCLSWALASGIPFISLSLFFTSFFESGIAFVCGVTLSAVIAAYPFIKLREMKREKRKAIENGLPGVISKTVLLTEAGLTVRNAWEKVSVSGSGDLYQLMRKATARMNNGVSVEDALQNFAAECGTKEARQFAGILAGNMSRGGEGMTRALRFLNSESWEGRKQRARLESQAAASGLLFPLLIMFVGIVLMIAIPLFDGLSF